MQVGRRAPTATPTPTSPQLADDAERRPSVETPGAARRRYAFELPFEPDLLPIFGLVLVALALRLWDLGAKALHHDESLHAVYSWYLYVGRGYVHDPMMHGPFLFITNALTYFVVGVNDFTARLMPALFGTVLVGLPWLLRNEIGRGGAVAAAAMLAISPSFLYYSRFLRQDIYVDVFTLLMVIGVFRYLATGLHRWFYTAVVATALLFATKEDVFISGFIAFTFLAGAWFLLPREPRAHFRARVRALGWSRWLWGAAVFLAINLVLYTTFFTNLRGICTALVTLPLEGCSGAKGALNYWLDQQDFRRGGQPWFYYVMLMPLYELPPLVFGALALFRARGKNFFFWFSAYWFAAALLIYSWAGEKMPWMLPQIALPLILMAGRLLGEWAEAGWGRRALSGRGLAIGGLLLFGVLCLLAWVNLGAAQGAVPLDAQSATLQRIALSVVVAAIAGGTVWLATRWGSRIWKPGLALGVLAILGAGWLRVSLGVNYDRPDTPTEPLVYVQSSPDVVFVAKEIERIAAQTGQGKDLRILMDNGWGDGVHESVAWPFEWYLRDYKNRTYFTKTIDPRLNLADYPVLLVMAPNIEPIQAQLAQFNGTKYRLNWWFPEDYKGFDAEGPGVTIAGRKIALPWLNFGLIKDTLSVPQNQLSLLKFLIYRQAPNELAGREFYAYINKNVPQIGFGGPASPAAAPSTASQPLAVPSGPRTAVQQQGPDGSIIFGRSAEGASVLTDPKNVAVAPDGRIYVAEGRAGRITAFNPDGTIASSWGSFGAGDGQLQEPWGVAVAPNGDVYVADTWNHRVQRFDASGKPLAKWGSLDDAKGLADGSKPSAFWGPRSIAISPSGEVYVSDTGNKRIQVFDASGRYLRMFGGEGTGPGQLREPVGLAFDSQGTLWVADAWNRRIQRFSPTGQPLAEFAVPAEWQGTAVTNKPYIAASEDGRIAASFPDSGRVLVFDTDGRQVAQFQLPQNGYPVGVSLAQPGRLLVADSRNGLVISYPLP
ncbi:MAG: TIGR03663 family protein [Chloroflexi bacterium]|nr:TIGR03663 family protein [Chloroflexota bacterium]